MILLFQRQTSDMFSIFCQANFFLYNCDKYLYFYIIFIVLDNIFRLAIFDNLFIVDSLIQKSILPYFTTISPKDPVWFINTFPYFWHPVKGIVRTITINMMVVISAERYRTVCYPLYKRHVSKTDQFHSSFYRVLYISNYPVLN